MENEPVSYTSPEILRPQIRHDQIAFRGRRLSADQRELLALKYGEDLGVVEIAVVLGIPAGTVKSRLHHAREELKRILKGDES